MRIQRIQDIKRAQDVQITHKVQGDQGQRERRAAPLRCVIICWALSGLGGLNAAHAEPKTVQRSNEMEFDARVIRGQRAEGAVYLFQRASRPLPPLLKYKRNYLSAIVTPVFGPKTQLGQTSLKRGQGSGVIVGSAARTPTSGVTHASDKAVKRTRTKSKRTSARQTGGGQ